MHTWSTQKGGGRPTAGQSLPWLPEELREVCAAGVSRIENRAGVRWCWRTNSLGFGILSKDHKDLVFDSKGLGQLLKRFEADCWAPGGRRQRSVGRLLQSHRTGRLAGRARVAAARIQGSGCGQNRSRRWSEQNPEINWMWRVRGKEESRSLTWVRFWYGNRNGQQKQKQIWVQGLTEWWTEFQGCWHRNGCVQPALGLYGSGRRSWATEFLWL